MDLKMDSAMISYQPTSAGTREETTPPATKCIFMKRRAESDLKGDREKAKAKQTVRAYFIANYIYPIGTIGRTFC